MEYSSELLRQYIEWTFSFSEIELQIIDICRKECTRERIIRTWGVPVSTELCFEIGTYTIILLNIDNSSTVAIESIWTTPMISRGERILDNLIQKYHKRTGEITISESRRIVFLVITRKIGQCNSDILEIRYSLSISSASNIVHNSREKGSGKDTDNRDNDHEFDEGKCFNIYM